MCDGEQFSSLLHCHASHATWDCAPSPFFHPMIKGSAINTTYRSNLHSSLITSTHLLFPIAIRSVHLKSNGPRSFCSNFSEYPPPSQPHYLSSRYNGQPCSIQLIHSLRSPHPLTTLCTRRTKVIGLPVLVTVAPQQPHLTDSMAREKKHRAWACNCILQLWNFIDKHSTCPRGQ